MKVKYCTDFIQRNDTYKVNRYWYQTTGTSLDKTCHNPTTLHDKHQASPTTSPTTYQNMKLKSTTRITLTANKTKNQQISELPYPANLPKTP